MKKLKILATLFLFILPVNSFADDTKGVEIFVNNLGNNIISIADDNKLTVNQKRDKLVNFIDSMIDIDWISKFVLGKYYRQTNDDQKQKFKKLYHEFMINTYSPKFTGYNGEKFKIVNIISEDNYYTAKCLFFPKDNAPTINLDFRVRKNTTSSKPEFFVFDVIAEGVSLIETQRSEFGSVIAKDGMDKFLVDLESRIKKLKIENAKPHKPQKGLPTKVKSTHAAND